MIDAVKPTNAEARTEWETPKLTKMSSSDAESGSAGTFDAAEALS